MFFRLEKSGFYFPLHKALTKHKRKGHKVIFFVHVGFPQPRYGISSLVAEIIRTLITVLGLRNPKAAQRGQNQMSPTPETLCKHNFPASTCGLWLRAVLDMGATGSGSLPLWSH